jgi:hypothetical protein
MLALRLDVYYRELMGDKADGKLDNFGTVRRIFNGCF